MDVSSRDVEAESCGSASRPGVRAAGRLAALLGTVSLAGCSLLGSPNATEPDTATPETDDVTGTQVGPSGSGSVEECEAELADVNAEIEAVRDQIRAADTDTVVETSTTDPLEARYERWQSAPDDVVNRAETVGIDARAAVVYLDLDGSGLATGWYVDDHHVLTNAHNVFHAGKRTESITAWTLDGEERATSVLGYVESNTPDVALLRTEESAPATLPIGEATYEPDEYLVQVGHPGGIGNWLTSLGQFSDKLVFQTSDGDTVEDVVTTVPGRSGVSGSPLLNFDGDVVAMTHGGQDISSREPDTAPAVAPNVVYDRPMAPRQNSLHVPIDVVVETYQQWL